MNEGKFVEDEIVNKTLIKSERIKKLQLLAIHQIQLSLPSQSHQV